MFAPLLAKSGILIYGNNLGRHTNIKINIFELKIKYLYYIVFCVYFTQEQRFLDEQY